MPGPFTYEVTALGVNLLALVRIKSAMALGADAFVFNPVTIEELEGALRKALPSG
ncbi:MAG: hypothetical protein WD906_01685 [Anaerolineales bacterium]